MGALVIVLTLLSFFQATLVPINLVLIVILLRSYIKVEPANLYLGFGFGLLLSHLNQLPLGSDSILFLILVMITRLISKAPFQKNIITALPFMFILLSINIALTAILKSQSVLLWPQILAEMLLLVPTYFILRLWEERFIPRKDFKLRV
jgi:hypothetical protein